MPGQPVGTHLPLGEKEDGDPHCQHPGREFASVALLQPRPGDRRDERGQRRCGQNAARRQARKGAGGCLVAGGGKHDAEVEASTGHGCSQGCGRGEDSEVAQVGVGIEAGNAHLGDERNDLGEEGPAQECEHLTQGAGARIWLGGVRHALI